ncbi:MAG: hypothetical protein ACM3VT_04080 [Solirubrobacterales bacterium]
MIALCAILLFAPEARSQNIGKPIRKKYTISGAIGLSGVTLKVTPSTGATAATTDADGNYSIEVEHGWAGTVTPTMTGYEFQPKETTYPKVTAGITEQNYTAKALQFRIAGSVGEAGVKLNGFPYEVISDPNGRYVAMVDYGWSGDVTPDKMGFSFDPLTKSYKQVTKNYTAENYKAKEAKFVISGLVGEPGIVMQGLPGNPVTDKDGRYTVEVRYGTKDLKVTPTKEGYTFTPEFMDYPLVVTEYVNQDYTFEVQKYTISGSAGLPDVQMKGFPEEVKTDETGYYTVTVKHGWAGKVTPEKPGYMFTPLNRPYTKVTANAENQDYTGEAVQLTIQGTVSGVSGVVELTGFPQGTVQTDEKGAFSVKVEYGFTGTITPVKEGYSFQPAERPYDSIKADKTKEDFKGSKITYTISGNTGEGGVTLKNLPGSVVSKGDGSYSVKVPYGWSGTVIPTKAGLMFQPAEYEYTQVLGDQTEQNFQAEPIRYPVTGKVLDKEGQAIEDVLIVADSQVESVSTDADGVFELQVKHGWKGKITPQKDGYTFNPPAKTFDAVTSPVPNISIVGEIKMLTITNVLLAEGEPVSDVTVLAEPGSYKATTDLKGKYSIKVPYGWTGELSFSKEEWDIPLTVPYPDPVTEDIDGTKPKPASKPKPQQTTSTKPAETTKPSETTKPPETTSTKPSETTSTKPAETTSTTGQDVTPPEGQGAIQPGMTRDAMLQRYNQAKKRLDALLNQAAPLTAAQQSEMIALLRETNLLEQQIAGVGGSPAEGPVVVTPSPVTGLVIDDATPKLLSVLAELARLTSTQIAVDLTVKDEPIAVGVASVQGMPIELALKRILDGTKKKYTFRKDADGHYEVFYPITNQFPGSDLLMALEALASDAEVSILPDPNVGGKTSASITGQPLEVALEMVLAPTSYVFKRVTSGTASYYVVGDSSIDSPSFSKISETRRLRLNSQTPVRMKELLAPIYQKYVQAESPSTLDPNDRGHAMVITAPAGLADTIERMIREFDTARRQVLLDARVVTMERTNMLNLGVEWQFPTMQAGGFYDGDTWTKAIGLGYTADAAFTNSLMATLNALEAQHQIDVVSNPQLVTQDGKQARLKSIQEEWFMMTDTSNSGNPYGYTNAELQKIESGTILSIVPRIGDSNEIELDLAVEISNSIAKGADSDLPIVTRRQAQNSVRVQNGGTVAVAGLTENRSRSVEKKVPVLGSIPVVGRLFRNNDEAKETKEIAVFVTATLIQQGSPMPGNQPAPTGTTLGVNNQAQPAGDEFKNDLANSLKRTQ